MGISQSQKKYLTIEQEAWFPNLKRENYLVTSLPTSDYNCIAHAAGMNNNWWWPDPDVPWAYWPDDLEKDDTLTCFIQAYGTQGYVVCAEQNPLLENGVQKVALFVDVDGKPTHAARQLEDGGWTSKLGEAEDIRHETLQDMEGGDGVHSGYGTVATILRRPAI